MAGHCPFLSSQHPPHQASRRGTHHDRRRHHDRLAEGVAPAAHIININSSLATTAVMKVERLDGCGVITSYTVERHHTLASLLPAQGEDFGMAPWPP